MRQRSAVQILIVFGERLVYLVPQVAMIVLITRILGSEFFGKYGLVLTWVAAFQLVADFGITEYLAREMGREPERGSRLLGEGIALALICSGVAVGLMLIAATLFRYPVDITEAIFLVSLILVPGSLIAASRGAAVACRRTEIMLAVGAVEGSVLLSLNVYWVLTEAGLIPILTTVVVARTLAAAVSLRLVHTRVTPIDARISSRSFRAFFRTAIPFGVASILVFPSIRFDVLLLSKLTPIAEVGAYIVSVKVTQLLFIAPLAFFMVGLPRAAWALARDREHARRQLTQGISVYLALLIPVGVAFIVFARPFVELVVGDGFGAAVAPLQLLMVAFILLLADVALAMICKAAGHQKRDLWFVVVATSSSIVLNVLLIPLYGATGAAAAQTLSVLAGLLMRWQFVGRQVVQLDWLKLGGPPLLASLAMGIVAAWLARRFPWPVAAFAFFVGCAGFTVWHYPLARDLWHQARRKLRGLPEGT